MFCCKNFDCFVSFGDKALEGSFLNHKRNKRKNKRHKKEGWVLGIGYWVLGVGG